MNLLKLKKIKLFISLAILAAIVVTGAASVNTASAQTIDELQAQIRALTAQLQALQVQVRSVQPIGPISPVAPVFAPTSSCTFNRDLIVGRSGPDVTCLQNYLTSTGHFSFSGGSTGFFGPVTQSAVAAWQAANNVSPAVGYFGRISQEAFRRAAASSSEIDLEYTLGTGVFDFDLETEDLSTLPDFNWD